MQFIGTIDHVPVYVCDAVVVPSGRNEGLEPELATRAAKIAKAGGDPAIVLSPAQLAALEAEIAAVSARYAAAVAKAEAKGRPAPEPPTASKFVREDDSDLIDEDPIEHDFDDLDRALGLDLFDDQKHPAEPLADPAADTQPIDIALE